MGRLFDEIELRKYILHDGCEKGCGYIDERDLKYIPTAEAITKYDYENRLKADLVAMLTEIQLEIEEREQHYKDKFLEPNNAVHEAAMGGRMFGCGECKEVIQQKINALKGNKDE